MKNLVRFLRCLALPDPHDERPVMHQKEITAAADLIEQQAARIKELEEIAARRLSDMMDEVQKLATLRSKIESAEVVAYERQGPARKMVTYVPSADGDHDELIRKEDLLK